MALEKYLVLVDRELCWAKVDGRNLLMRGELINSCSCSCVKLVMVMILVLGRCSVVWRFTLQKKSYFVEVYISICEGFYPL